VSPYVIVVSYLCLEVKENVGNLELAADSLTVVTTKAAYGDGVVSDAEYPGESSRRSGSVTPVDAFVASAIHTTAVTSVATGKRAFKGTFGVPIGCIICPIITDSKCVSCRHGDV